MYQLTWTLLQFLAGRSLISGARRYMWSRACLVSSGRAGNCCRLRLAPDRAQRQQLGTSVQSVRLTPEAFIDEVDGQLCWPASRQAIELRS